MALRVTAAVCMTFVASVVTLGAQNIELDAPIDFSITLQDLSRFAAEEAETGVDYESYVLIEGYISGTLVNERTDERFQASVDLVGGEWEGLDEVHTYKARVLVEGEEYRDRVFERPPRDPPSDAIIPGRRALVVARLLRVEQDSLGDRRIPVLETVALRISR